MTNFIDYINWRGDLSFEQSPLNDVDNLIFAQLAYTNFDEIFQTGKEEMTIKEFGERFFAKYTEAEIEKTFIQNVYAAAIIEKAMKSERFADLKLYGYVTKIDYENDGPGFGNGFMDGIDYKEISGKIRTIIPQSSAVGIMLEHEKNYKVIKSNQIAFRQHDTLSWEVLGTGFIYLEELTKGSKHVVKTITNWLDTLNKDEKAEFIEALFGILEAPGAKTLEDVFTEKWTILKNIKNLDEDTRKAIFKAIGLLITENNKIIKHNIFKNTPFKPNDEKISLE